MSARPNPYIDLRWPVVVLILAATAVPVGLKPPDAIGFSFQALDFLENIAGYVPVGLVLGGLPAVRALAIATAISLFAETSQCVMMLRDPSIMDVVANVVGAATGVAAAARWKPRVAVELRRWMISVAAVLAVALVAVVAVTAAPGLSARGATAPGILEAHWTFDEAGGNKVLDSSPHDLRGNIKHGAQRVPGIHGGAISLDGFDDYIDFGRQTEFRMSGSLTVSAWIKVRANPIDDAVVVSDLQEVGTWDGNGNGAGFQLDTTVDSGSRTIGFKLRDSCGDYFARYGSTPLQLDTWYFLTGVYDAKTRTVDVYLNGQPDNGHLSGTVPSIRRSSLEPLSVGRRSDSDRFNFAGLIDDVRIYSRALAVDEVVADMNGAATAAAERAATAGAGRHDDGRIRSASDSSCSWSVEPEQARFPLVVGIMGMLIGVMALGFRRFRAWMLGVTLGAAGGFLLFQITTPTLPPFNAWSFPLTSVIAAIALIASVRRKRQ